MSSIYTTDLCKKENLWIERTDVFFNQVYELQEDSKLIDKISYYAKTLEIELLIASWLADLIGIIPFPTGSTGFLTFNDKSDYDFAIPESNENMTQLSIIASHLAGPYIRSKASTLVLSGEVIIGRRICGVDIQVRPLSVIKLFKEGVKKAILHYNLIDHLNNDYNREFKQRIYNLVPKYNWGTYDISTVIDWIFNPLLQKFDFIITPFVGLMKLQMRFRPIENIGFRPKNELEDIIDYTHERARAVYRNRSRNFYFSAQNIHFKRFVREALNFGKVCIGIMPTSLLRFVLFHEKKLDAAQYGIQLQEKFIHHASVLHIPVVELAISNSYAVSNTVVKVYEVTDSSKFSSIMG